jgi:SAM-dependent methyltransferase
VRADGARLPGADASFDAVAALYTLYHYDDPLQPLREARRVLHSGGLLAACAPARDSTPELTHVVPSWGARSTFDAEDAPAVVASVFSAPGDQVEVDSWDGPLRTLSTFDEAVGFLRCHSMSDDAARDAAARLELPMSLTARGCVVYATKG